MTLKKYIALFQVTISGNQVVKIVDLGDAKKPLPIVITDNTYAFKIFTSYLDIVDVCCDFFESDENYNSVLVSIGREMSATSFAEKYPYSKKLAAIKGNEKDYVAIIAKTYNGENTVVSMQNRYTKYRVMTKEHVDELGFKVLLPKELGKNYSYACAL